MRQIKKAISLMLVLTMLMPLASPAFTAQAVEENEVMPYLSDMGLQGIGGDGDSQLFGGGFGGWGLKTMLSGSISGLVGIGLNQAYSAIFGKDSDRIMEAIAELSKQIDEIDAKINLLISETQKGNINAFLNDYRSDLAPYKALLKDFETARRTIGDNNEKSTNFALSVYYGTNPSMKRYGDNIVAVVRELKAMLVDDVRIINGKKCNVFGAFDLLERYNNKWEHQGYDIRSEFRNTALGLFTDFAVIAQKAVADAIADCKRRNDTSALDDAELAKECLKEYIATVDAMEVRCSVIQHPDIRIFRDTKKGTTKYAFYRRIDPASVKEPTSNYDWYTYKKFAYSDYIHCMTTTNHIQSRTERNGGTEVISGQVWCGVLRDIYESYNDSSKSLYDIFFDREEGDFINVGQLKKGTRFATDYYKFTQYTSGGFWSDKLFHQRLDTNVVDDNGNLNETVRLLRLTQVQGQAAAKVDHLLEEKFFSVIPYYGAIKQGALFAPNDPSESETAGMISGMEASYVLPSNQSITLSIQPKDGATYQWFVDKNDGDGFVEIENEIGTTYTISSLNPSMNGWRYQCAIAEAEVSDWGEGYTVADPVTLVLTGEGIPGLVTEHEVDSPEELKFALDKVTDGSWEGHTIKLMADINYPHTITLVDKSVAIDLNGHTLNVQPSSSSQPNINPMSNKAEIAAIYALRGKLDVNNGSLNVIVEQGIDYGVYAEASEVEVNNITYTGSGTAAYATDYGVITADSISTTGEGAHAIENFDGKVTVGGDVTANGKASCGVYADSSEGTSVEISIGGNLTVSGENSRGAAVNGRDTYLHVGGNVTATGKGASGMLVSNGGDGYMASIFGDVSASDVAVNVSAGAGVLIKGSVTSSDEGTSAIYAVGGSVNVEGNVTSTGISGTAINISKWDLIDSAVGGFVIVDGKITANTPLRMESLPLGENEHTGKHAMPGMFDHYIYTDGTNTLWAYDNNFVSTNPNAQVPSIITHPQSKTVDPGNAVTLTISAKVSDGGTLSYQWYSNTTDDLAGSTLIDGATNASYTPHTDTVGTTYYYCVITNTNESAQGHKTAQAISRLAAVRVGYLYKVEADIAALSIGYAPGDSAAAVTQNVSLTVTGAVYGSSITWTSSNTSVISDSGLVTRPSFTSGDASVTVTASVYNNGASSTKDFDLVVLKLPQITYTVIFDKNGGDTEASPTTKEVISGGNAGILPIAPTRSGYTFIGWNTQANGSGTVFTATTAVTSSIRVYAQWSKNSSDGGGGSSGSSGGTITPLVTPKTEINVAGNTVTSISTITASVDNNSNATAAISLTQVNEAIGKVMEEAKKQGEGMAARIEFKVDASSDVTSVEISTPKEAVSQALGAGISALTISTPVASITFDANTLFSLSEEATGELKIMASKVEVSSLSLEAQRMVGKRPVFDFSVTSGDKIISEFGGDVLVSVPYIPKEGEDPNAIIIYYIYDSGKLEVVSNCLYDPVTGRVSFSTRHFSKYAVGYNKINFKDVDESAWYSKAVGFIASREISLGTGGGNFSPEAKLTRGQFIVMLMKAYGIAPDADPKDNFTDAGAAYYTGYLAAAKRLSISSGVGNNMFAPDREITRQEMFTLLYNSLKAIGRLPKGAEGKPLSSFSDAENLASWAKEAITLLVKTGIISGNGAKLSPMNTTTRAEMAQVLYNLLSK